MLSVPPLKLRAGWRAFGEHFTQFLSAVFAPLRFDPGSPCPSGNVARWRVRSDFSVSGFQLFSVSHRARSVAFRAVAVIRKRRVVLGSACHE